MSAVGTSDRLRSVVLPDSTSQGDSRRTPDARSVAQTMTSRLVDNFANRYSDRSTYDRL